MEFTGEENFAFAVDMEQLDSYHLVLPQTDEGSGMSISKRNSNTGKNNSRTHFRRALALYNLIFTANMKFTPAMGNKKFSVTSWPPEKEL